LPSKDDLKRELENIEAELIGFIQE
jgi:hypothetical protein